MENILYVGTGFIQKAAMRDPFGNIVTPTLVVLTVKRPDATTFLPTLSISGSVYTATYLLTQAGIWKWKWVATDADPIKNMVEEGYVTVNPVTI
jgi:hypothetical protein